MNGFKNSKNDESAPVNGNIKGPIQVDDNEEEGTV